MLDLTLALRVILQSLNVVDVWYKSLDLVKEQTDGLNKTTSFSACFWQP